MCHSTDYDHLQPEAETPLRRYHLTWPDMGEKVGAHIKNLPANLTFGLTFSARDRAHAEALAVESGASRMGRWELEEVPDDAPWKAAPFAMVEKTGRFRPCERCGGTPAVHNPHPLNPAFVGHEYV